MHRAPDPDPPPERTPDLPGDGRRRPDLSAIEDDLRRLAHELSLTLGYTELLREDARLPPELAEQVAEAHRGAEAAGRTLQRVMERVSRL